MRDGRGSFIDAGELPKGVKPPYRGVTVWQGTHGDWMLTARRLDGDPMMHCICLHTVTGISHAERVDAKTPAQVKAWADLQPAELPVDWIGGRAA